MIGKMQFRSSLSVIFIIIVAVALYSLPAVSALSQSTQLQIHPDYDCEFQNSRLIPNASNIIGARLIKQCQFDLTNDAVSSKDLISTASKVSARSQSFPAFLIDRKAYRNSFLSEPFLLHPLTLGKFKNPTGIQRPPLTVDLGAHQNLFRPAPETNEKHLNCDCYQISAQPRFSSSFSASLETLQKHINYEFQNVILLRQAMTHSSYSLENNKEFSILGERLIETIVSLRLATKDLEISLNDLNNKMSEVLKVDTSCAADGMRLGLQNIVRVSSSTDSSTSSIVCDALRAMLWTIALDSGKYDDAHNVFWAVHSGDGKAI